MPLTNYPHGLASFGMPVFGGGGMTLPLMGQDAKAFFVDGANGSDDARGTDPSTAFKTVGHAYSKTVDKRGDVVYLLNDGNTSGTSRESASITWSNDNTHLVGLCAPAPFSNRARITTPSGNTELSDYNPFFTVSGNGCVFMNVQIAPFGSEDGVAMTGVSVTGDRNVFSNCHLIGVVHANVGDEADAEDLLLSGCEECLFLTCTIGVDTVTRTGACANIRTASQATRNIFKDCLIPMWADADAPRFLIVPSGGLDRYILFDNCKFINPVGASSTSQSAALSIDASAGGNVLFHNSALFEDGTLPWGGGSNSLFSMPAPSATTPGEAATES